MGTPPLSQKRLQGQLVGQLQLKRKGEMGRELFAGPLFSEREAGHAHVQPSSLLEPHNQGLLRHRHDFLESPSIQPVASPNFSKFQDAYNSYNIMVSFTSGPLGFLIASIQDEWQAFLHNIYIYIERDCSVLLEIGKHRTEITLTQHFLMQQTSYHIGVSPRNHTIGT